jgi:molybdopterin molybdotransferase
MLEVDEAVDAIMDEAVPLPPSIVPLGECLGLIPVEDIVSDIDSPPFDKALMDGFAVRAADVVSGTATLRVVEEIMAGQVASRPVESGEAIQIMTGAPLPRRATAVVRIEDARFDATGELVHLATDPVKPGMNILRKGTSMRRGDIVVSAGRKLRAQELGALAEMGRYEVAVRRRPKVAVLATGDELVEIWETPGPGQIRNSNETMLTAQIRQAGGEPVPLGIARDNREHLGQKIREGLNYDILLLSGGVSAGKLDLVPSELEAAGVEQVFHKVRIKPGKPLWFGVCDSDTGVKANGDAADGFRYVFGLPGNPVSSMVCFELFVRPVIRRLMGVEPAVPDAIAVPLLHAHKSNSDRPTFHPACLDWNEIDDEVGVRLIRWHGSADLRATVEANALVLVPAGRHMWEAGDLIDVLPWTSVES